MYKQYRVKLTKSERIELKQLINTGKTAARKLTHARILLKSDESQSRSRQSAEQVSKSLEISTATVYRVRQRFVEEGFEAALDHKKPWRTRTKKIDGNVEANLLALSCSNPPNGRKEWTMQLLADKLVELKLCDSISDEAVRRTLKKMKSNPG